MNKATRVDRNKAGVVSMVDFYKVQDYTYNAAT